ncbi:hypothetical protein [Limosilactobacillus allomucosae]|uniref:hypothetical protein n=1 Tax=Limosilactobacillus allomucosae TaxID=3142938 RepID=UPI003263CE85
MNNWQTFYSASEQAIILAKHQRGIGFPAELYQRALKAGKSIPHYQRIKACQQAQRPLLTEDIQNLTAVINHQPLLNPASSSAKQRQRTKSKKQQPVNTRPHEKNRSKKQRSATNNAKPDAKTSAKKQLRIMLKRYDGLVANAEEIGVMQFEKHRRYRNRAFEVLNDPDAAMAAMHRQANYLEGQIQRLEERMQQRMF